MVEGAAVRISDVFCVHFEHDGIAVVDSTPATVLTLAVNYEG